MTLPAYSVVIATYERPRELTDTLTDLFAQTHPPSRVVVVDASPGDATEQLIKSLAKTQAIHYLRAPQPSAARQRNAGAEHVTTPLIAFADDDLRVPPDVFEKLCAPFAAPEGASIGGVSGRIRGLQHPVPKGALRRYYRLQAGYDHPTYGGKLFGPGINCLPSYEEADGPLIPADWLNSGCTVYRRELFELHRFPDFKGYSPMEDVHLSARIGRTHRLYFHKEAIYEHLDAPSPFKQATRDIARMRRRHQRIVAREILGLKEPILTLKLLVHRLFVSVSILRQSGGNKREALIGTWT